MYQASQFLIIQSIIGALERKALSTRIFEEEQKQREKQQKQKSEEERRRQAQVEHEQRIQEQIMKDSEILNNKLKMASEKKRQNMSVKGHSHQQRSHKLVLTVDDDAKQIQIDEVRIE